MEEVNRLEKAFSRFLPESDISRINRSAGNHCVPVSDDTFDLLTKSVEFSNRCNGCFDVTIGPLVDVWRAAKLQGFPPSERAIHEAVLLTGYVDLLLDPVNRTAGLARAGQSIDLGGIGKGYAADCLLKVYEQFGIQSACSNMGGHVVTVGTRPNGSHWQIGIQHPRNEDSLAGAVSVAGKSVVTSGDYQRFFTSSGGKRYHHILDPLTGCPADAGLISVTVVSDDSFAADALSTAIFVAGLEQGHDWLAGFPGTDAICIGRDFHIWVTP